MPDERLVAEQLLRLQMESEETDSFPGLLKGQDDVPHNMLVDKKGKEKPLKANKEGKCIPEAWFTELPADGTWHCVYQGNNKVCIALHCKLTPTQLSKAAVGCRPKSGASCVCGQGRAGLVIVIRPCNCRRMSPITLTIGILVMTFHCPIPIRLSSCSLP